MDSNNYMMPVVKNQPFKSIGKDCQISPDALILGRENIEIGNNVRIDAGVKILASKGFLKIGNHVHISCNTTLLCGGGITIGDHCGISFNNTLVSVSEDFTDGHLTNPNVPEKFRNPVKQEICMEALSMIASGCFVSPGTKLLKGSVLGALSYTRPGQILQEYGIHLGRPAAFSRKRTDNTFLAIEFEKEYNGVPQDPPQG